MFKSNNDAVKLLGSNVVAMVTPFDKDDRLDLNKVNDLMDKLINAKCDSVLLSGTTGESPTLFFEEKVSLFKEVKKNFNNKIKIIQSVSTNSTSDAVNFVTSFEEFQPDGFLVVTPYYNKPSQDGIFQHFKKVSENTNIPIMIYDIPSRTGVDIRYETMLKLAEIENIIAVKESKGGFSEAIRIMENTKLAYYSGDDSLNYEWFCLGAVGVVSVIGHFYSEQLYLMKNLVSEGKLQQARKIAYDLLPISESVSGIGGVSLTKSIFKKIGFDLGLPRLPLMESTDELIAYFSKEIIRKNEYK